MAVVSSKREKVILAVCGRYAGARFVIVIRQEHSGPEFMLLQGSPFDAHGILSTAVYLLLSLGLRLPPMLAVPMSGIYLVIGLDESDKHRLRGGLPANKHACWAHICITPHCRPCEICLFYRL